MSWILVLSLFSNTSGNYVREFSSEQECVAEMNTFIRKNEANADVKYVGCMSSTVVAENIEE